MSNEAGKKKKSKRTLVPKLRFPEFLDAGEWVAVQLEQIAKRVTTKNLDGIIVRVLTNSAEFGILDQRDYFDKYIANVSNVDGYYIIELGDYVYNPRISTLAPVGPISRNNIGKGVMSPLYTVFRFKDENTDFYQHYFKSSSWHSYLRRVSSMGARHDRMSITISDFMAMPVPEPLENEQQKIADCLTSLDELITAEADQLDALKAHKKGLMQQLFPREGETTPRLRFPEFEGSGEWESTNIGEHVNLQSGFPFEGKDIVEDSAGVPLMRGINITEGRIRHDPDYDRFYLEPAENLAKYRLQEGDLVIGMDGSKVGKNSAMITSADAGALLVQRVARLRSDRQVTMRFIFQHVNSPKFHSYVDRINTSSGIPHISAKQIKYFPLALPCDAEQQRIADCLTSLDDLITAQAEKIETLKTHKKGLMQQLFPAPEGQE